MTDTRTRLVFAAMDLFHRQGFHATAVEEILAAAKANSGSLYHYFRGKEELLEGVLDAYLAGLWPVVMSPAFARAADPIDAVFEVLADYRERLRSTALDYSCPIGRLALEIGTRPSPAREKISENFAHWCAAIQTRLDDPAARLPADLDTAALAQHILTVMEGAVMLARSQQSLAPFDASVAQLERYLRGLRSPSPSKPA
jgi:TetR/AcrR family transcriptional repressor of nem operon